MDNWGHFDLKSPMIGPVKLGLMTKVLNIFFK